MRMNPNPKHGRFIDYGRPVGRTRSFLAEALETENIQPTRLSFPNVIDLPPEACTEHPDQPKDDL